ncbi:MAG TPA: PAS domain S-box protein, partial [Candidatus Methanoperedens sp.]
GRPPKLSVEDLRELEKSVNKKERWETEELKRLVMDKFGVDLSAGQINRILRHKLKIRTSRNSHKKSPEEKKFRAFFENSGDAIIICDLQDRIDAWNPGAEKMFGWKADEAIRKKLKELIVPGDMLDELSSIKRDAKNGRTVRGVETVGVHRNGTWINISITVFPLRDDRNRIIGLSHILRDLTGCKKAEEALWESQEKLRNVMESAPVGISITTPEDRVIDINSTGLKILGYDSKEDFLKIPTSAHFSDFKDSERFYEITKKGKIRDFESKFKHKDGTLFWGSVSTIIQRNPTGSSQFINVFRDITERRRTEEVLRIVYDELETKVQERTAELEKASEVMQVEIEERHKAYEAMRESEERYRTLIESARDLIFSFSPEGTIISLNPAFETITGHSREEWIGRSIKHLFHPDDLDKARMINQTLLEGRTLPSGLEIRVLSKSGESIEMEYSIAPQIRNGKVTGGLGVARDITERKKMEKELRRARDDLDMRVRGRTAELADANQALQAEIMDRRHAEEERERLIEELLKKQNHAEKLAGALKKERDTLNIIMDNAMARLAYLDPQFNFIRVNSAYINDLGRNRDELLGHNYFKFFPNPKNEAIFKKARDRGIPVESKAEPIKFIDQPWKGITYWDWMLAPVKDMNGRVVRLVLSLTEVTERIRAEQGLMKALTYAEGIVDTVPEPLMILGLKQQVLLANQAFYKTFGVSTNETINRPLYELGNRQWDIPRLREMLEDIISGNKQVQNFEVETEFPGIGKRIMLLNASPFLEEDAKRILLSIEDITDRKKIEEILLENERLISANKARSDFLAIMSHELRTPLTSIIGYSIILKEKAHGNLNKKQELYVDSVLTSSNHLLSLINSVLDLAKIEAGKLELAIEKIPVRETIDEILNLIKEKTLKRKISLKREFDPQLLHIAADRQKFKQILFNLLSNAVKFSKEEGGTVTISTRKEGDIAQISVIDTGIGIKKEDFQRLFHEFEQLDSGTSRKYEGTGLGLAITKQLVELHGGKIEVESRFGEGSKFTIYLPLADTKT